MSLIERGKDEISELPKKEVLSPGYWDRGRIWTCNDRVDAETNPKGVGVDPLSEFVVILILGLVGICLIGFVIDSWLGWRRADRKEEKKDDWFSSFE